MNLARASQYRRAAGKSAAFFCLIFFIAVLDILIAHIRHPFNLFDVLPGTSEYFNISVKADIESLESFTCQGSSEFIRVRFESIYKGFWFGGKMCRGLIIIDPDIKPGEYSLTFHYKEDIAKGPLFSYHINVYPDQKSLRQNSKSFFRRHFGISPWIAIALDLPFILIALGSVFYFSRETENLLQKSGKAEIYRIRKSESGYEIAFGLGAIHGIRPGIQLSLLDEHGRPAGYAEVFQVVETDSFAKTGPEYPIRPGYIVSKTVTD